MTKAKTQLYSLWENISHIPAWARIMWLASKYTNEYDDEDIKELEKIEEEFLGIAEEEEKKWKEQNYKNLPRTERGWLEVFPEAKEILPEKIREWKIRKSKIISVIKEKLRIIKEKSSPENQWFRREMVKIWEGEKLLEIDKNISRLTLAINNEQLKTKTGQNFIEEELQRARETDIREDVLRDLQKTRKVSQRVIALCPFHPEKNPSFTVYENGSYYCFSCKESGTAVDYFMKIHNMTFQEAVKYLIGEK